MSGNNKPFIEDPDDFDGTYVGAGDFETVVENKYDIRAFVEYKIRTGKEWKELTESEKNMFIVETP